MAPSSGRQAAALARSVELSIWMAAQPVPTRRHAPASGLAVAALSLVACHRAAIQLLLSNEAVPAALALAGPTYHCHLSGAWLRFCATEADVGRAERAGMMPATTAMQRDLQRRRDVAGQFGADNELLWDPLTDHSQADMRQMRRKVHAPDAARTQDEDEVLDLLAFTDVYGLMAGISLAALAGAPTHPYGERMQAAFLGTRARRLARARPAARSGEGSGASRQALA